MQAEEIELDEFEANAVAYLKVYEEHYDLLLSINMPDELPDQDDNDEWHDQFQVAITLGAIQTSFNVGGLAYLFRSIRRQHGSEGLHKIKAPLDQTEYIYKQFESPQNLTK